MAKTDNVYLTGDREKRLPGHASFCVEYIEGEAMLLLLAAKGIFSASGSACSSKALKASPVLLSMGIPSGLAQGSIVFSLGMGNTPEDIDYVTQSSRQLSKDSEKSLPIPRDGEIKRKVDHVQ